MEHRTDGDALRKGLNGQSPTFLKRLFEEANSRFTRVIGRVEKKQEKASGL